MDSGLEELANLIVDLRAVQERIDDPQIFEEAGRILCTRERVLKTAIADSALILLPALLETLFGLVRRVDYLEQEALGRD